MMGLTIEQCRFVMDNRKFMYPLDKEIAYKVKEYVCSHQEYFYFVDYALGEREALFRPFSIIQPFNMIEREQVKNYVKLATNQGVMGVEKDFFRLFFHGHGPNTIEYLEANDYKNVSLALTVFIYTDGTWSICD